MSMNLASLKAEMKSKGFAVSEGDNVWTAEDYRLLEQYAYFHRNGVNSVLAKYSLQFEGLMPVDTEPTPDPDPDPDPDPGEGEGEGEGEGDNGGTEEPPAGGDTEEPQEPEDVVFNELVLTVSPETIAEGETAVVTGVLKGTKAGEPYSEDAVLTEVTVDNPEYVNVVGTELHGISVGATMVTAKDETGMTGTVTFEVVAGAPVEEPEETPTEEPEETPAEAPEDNVEE